MNNSDMPAMPQDRDWKNDMENHLNSPKHFGAPSDSGIGLTKREHFAAMAMQGILSRVDAGADHVAREALNFADSLLAALEKQQ